MTFHIVNLSEIDIKIIDAALTTYLEHHVKTLEDVYLFGQVRKAIRNIEPCVRPEDSPIVKKLFELAEARRVYIELSPQERYTDGIGHSRRKEAATIQ